jgi:glycosyltransferase involved in cell wall biosynthesis
MIKREQDEPKRLPEMGEPLVSIIVPVYNVEKYLSTCLDSILAQTIREIEVICVNGGSSDASPQILDEYAKRDARIRVIHQENRGVSGARNTGMRHARAPYIGFVDSDDWIEPQTYELALAKMQGDEELDVVYWGINECVEENRDVRLMKAQSPFRRKRDEPTTGKHVFTDSVRCELLRYVWNKLYKTEWIRRYDIVFPEGLTYEDNSFWWKYAVWVRCGYRLPLHLYNYRVGRENAITTLADKNKQSVSFLFMRLFEEVYAYYARFGLLESHAALLAEILAIMLRYGVRYSTDYVAFMREAKRFVANYPNLPDTRAHTFWYLRSGKSFARFYPLSPLEFFFSVTNIGPKKIFRVLGLEFAVDRSLFGRKRECS